MKTKFMTFRNVSAGVVMALSTFCAQAVSLNVGDTLALPGTKVAAEPNLAGTVLIDENIPFTFGGISGHVQQRIVKSSVDGTLDFYWRVFNDASSKAAIGSFRVGNFVAPEYNANWRTDGLGDDQPDQAHRLSWGNVNFLFNGTGLLPGKSSMLFFFNTTATEYVKTAQYDVTGTGAGNISSLFAAYTPVLKTATTPPTSCPVATFDSKGALHIPEVDASAAGLGTYKVDMQLHAYPVFEVTGLTLIP
jgi:hypothetical protein